MYSQWSTQAAVTMAGKGASALTSITRVISYGRRAIFGRMGAKASDEEEMCQHQGLAWAVAAQYILRLFRRSKDRHPGYEIYEHQVRLQERAQALQEGSENKSK
eukprot:5027237-Karenia_brevis.AAC.1